MRFFEAQQNARRNTFILGVLFILNVLILSALNALAVSVIFKKYPLGLPTHAGGNPYEFEIKVFVYSFLIFLGIMAYFIARNPKGPELAELLGGTQLITPTNDNEKKLLNVVEEMAIASGVPIPQVYVLQQDQGINAFAAGTDPNHIVIGVTQGALDLLSRDELQGVIGHEFSHILNEDMSLNLKLAAVVSTFLFVSNTGRKTLPRRGRGHPLSLVLIVFGAIGYLLGRVLQSYISQQREYLADASGVQFTRNPEGLAKALAKISLGSGSKLKTHHSQYAHIFFAEGFSSAFNNFFSTHPPLRSRIQQLMPREKFDDFISRVQNEMKFDPVIHENTQNKVNKIQHDAAVMSAVAAPSYATLALSQQIVSELSPLRGYLQNSQNARGALALLTFYSQQQYPQAKELIRSEFQSDMVFEKIVAAVESENKLQRVSLFHYTLASLRSLNLLEKKQLLEKMETVFHSDGVLNLLEILLFINARDVLLPGYKITYLPHALKLDLDAKSFNPLKNDYSIDDIDLMVKKKKHLSLIKKKEFIEEISPRLLESELVEEFRLLCLAVGVPIPIQES